MAVSRGVRVVIRWVVWVVRKFWGWGGLAITASMFTEDLELSNGVSTAEECQSSIP